MQRGSDRLSAHRDDEMKHELQGLLRSGHPTRTEEWHDPEPIAEDDPEVAYGPVTPSRAPSSLESLRLELARNLTRGAFPAGPRELARGLRRGHAPDALVERVEGLPHEAHYTTVQELAEALTGPPGSAGA
ncbi:DUF2795 domain-containing protein [Streptomyces griseoviridis]|uniref:DUF2795 domain-containing protein n=3 Tax=Streptomyces TaxID=1883 RepID=A0A918LG34_STRGD|nr:MULTISPECIES: DUF2795 domain-containing protein [Streptomyces]MDP9685183.1 hypothetical protein [Streptomyces griseoviridis]GGS42012.1 hypothetical protein GCM10010238_34570 [Streptomyces niveoruber]GGS95311.1 hypothetical protein GCM10010240_30840 [Streptomyces griseoviridis]GGU32266.1 hypothetical protein GCM10010259_23520 [Streptomyces daghestanicus]GHI29732.1 hypothetical protein Sdagh_14620 [Streptomyces daghestanicus]